jgi:hypothetical protein
MHLLTVRIKISSLLPVVPFSKEFAGCFKVMSPVQVCEQMLRFKQFQVVTDS